MMEKNNRAGVFSRRTIISIVLIAIVALSIIFVSVFVTTNVSASFLTGAYSSDQARVAKWDVETSFSEDAISYEKHGTEPVTYDLTVTNDSETADNIDIVLSGLPDGVTVVAKEDGETQGTATFSEGAAKIEKVTTLDMSQSKTLELVFTVPAETQLDEYTLDIRVDHTQID